MRRSLLLLLPMLSSPSPLPPPLPSPSLAPLTIFTLPSCASCLKLKALLSRPPYAAHPLVEIDVDLHPESRAGMIRLSDSLTHASITLGVPLTPRARALFFPSACYQLGPHALSLDDVEHGLLRSEPGRFPPGDAREGLRVQLDKRVHFALNCGASSCPPVRR
ncbi:hypothetical protein TeGR_g12793 [Tetraparma gracilis]|uniref:Uncharacterized protein n=1 Tax=Tetraparma gracilis TaxID=2962635 RepID=A0ABQ6N4T2_9STRA|nr:hypothetical protein TeGR_g12793 [Tetraparma gracilis]